MKTELRKGKYGSYIEPLRVVTGVYEKPITDPITEQTVAKYQAPAPSPGMVRMEQLECGHDVYNDILPPHVRRRCYRCLKETLAANG